MEYTKAQKDKAIENAMAFMFCGFDGYESGVDCYNAIQAASIFDDLSAFGGVWEPFEHWTAEDVMGQVDSLIADNLSMVGV